MSVLGALGVDDRLAEHVTARLVVAWQHPGTRSIQAVGLLEESVTHGYRFRYLRRAAGVPGFRPFLGFSDLGADYRSRVIFPLFSQRVMDPRRPDFARYLDSLDLNADATPMELLARSNGMRVGDTIQLFPVPPVDVDGATECRFLVHGVRHQEGAVERIDALSRGQALQFEHEPGNPKNRRAILVTSGSGGRLGWAPDMLLDYIHEVLLSDYALVVDRANGSDSPPHMRLLVVLRGRITTSFRPFAGPGWLPVVP